MKGKIKQLSKRGFFIGVVRNTDLLIVRTSRCYQLLNTSFLLSLLFQETDLFNIEGLKIRISYRIIKNIQKKYSSKNMLFPKTAIVTLFVTLATNLIITPLTTNPLIKFDFLCQTIISKDANTIYTVQLEPETNKNVVNRYSLANGDLQLSTSYTFESISTQSWSIILTIDQLVTIPMITNTSIMTFNPISLTPLRNMPNNQHFLNIISSDKYKVKFLSTDNGSIYYTDNNNSLGSFAKLMDSKHMGNIFLSLSPNNRFLCSTDQFTGYVSVWSVLELRKLYELKTPQNGIRAHSWDQSSKIIYAFGYQSGQFYQFNIQNSMQILNQASSKLTYVTSCFYFYQTNQVIAFSYNQSAVVSYSVSSNNYQTLVIYQGAEKIQFQKNLNQFSIFNNKTASYYAVKSLCAPHQYLDIQSNNCKLCGAFCLSCLPGLCTKCPEGYTLSFDGFICQNNSSISQNKTIKYKQRPLFSQYSTHSLNMTLNFINKTFNMPAQRQFLNVFFQLFSSFDHLFLFIYHNRTYGSNMKFYLQLIHDTLDYRFNIIDNKICQSYLGIDFNQWKQNVDFKANYSLAKFVQIQNNGQGLIVNNLQYFFLNIPLALISICLAKILFHLSFNYPISLLFRKFQFFGVIIIVLLQGNLQFFFFAITGDFLTLFYPNYISKLYTAASIIAGGLFISLSTMGIFSLYLFYKKHSKFWFQNSTGNLASLIYFLTTNGIMNIFRGIIHRIMITRPQEQAIALMVLEITQIFIHVYFLKRTKAVQSTFILTLFVISNISRVIFIFSLLFSSQRTVFILDQIHTCVIFTAIILIFLGSVYSINELVRQVKKIVEIQLYYCRSKNKIGIAQTAKSQVKICRQMPMNTNKNPSASHQIRKHVKFNQHDIQREGSSINRAKYGKKNDLGCFKTMRVREPKRQKDSKKFLNIVFTKLPLPG